MCGLLGLRADETEIQSQLDWAEMRDYQPGMQGCLLCFFVEAIFAFVVGCDEWWMGICILGSEEMVF